jgi:hypothetical protein
MGRDGMEGGVAARCLLLAYLVDGPERGENI